MLVNVHAAAKRALVLLVLESLPTGFTEADCALPNSPFETPNNSPWLRVSVIPTNTRNVSQGAYQRTTGVMVVDLFYPQGVGDADADSAADEIIQALANTENEYVKLYEATPHARVDGPWWRVQIDINFTYEGLTRA